MVEALSIAGASLAGAALSFPFSMANGAVLKKRGLKADESKFEKIASALAFAVAAGLLSWHIGFGWRLLYLMLILFCGAMIAAADMKFRIIPNELVLALMVLSAIFGLAGQIKFNILSSLGGFVVCFLIFSLPALFKKNVGAGDLKLAAAVGFSAGFSGSLVAVAIMGALVLGYTLIQNRLPVFELMKSYIPMGPFIVAGMIIVQAI